VKDSKDLALDMQREIELLLEERVQMGHASRLLAEWESGEQRVVEKYRDALEDVFFAQ
jgi:hypothetical protein